MLLGRDHELNYLNSVFQKEGSQILVVYGQKYVGKTALFREFIADKDSFYYCADAGSERGQLYLLGKKLRLLGVSVPDYPESFLAVFENIPVTAGKKKVIVLEGFDQLVKGSPAFMADLTDFIKNASEEYLILLGCGSIGFVENDLVTKIGKSALSLSGFLKIRELGFAQLRQYFPSYSAEDCILLYAVLGGVPGFWRCIDSSLSVKENICRHILAEDGILFCEGDGLVRDQLREPAVYFSILSALAEGKNKLNDLYQHTEYSRAKISVYLKNLMELGIVSKVFSVDTRGRDHLKKGIYYISDQFMFFWFRFVYPYRSELSLMTPEAFYDTFVDAGMTSFCAHAFSKICQETMLSMNRAELEEAAYVKSGCFDGKSGMIDFVGQNAGDDYTVAFAEYEKSIITRTDLARYVKLIQSAKIEPIRIYVFYRDRIDEEIRLLAKTKEELILIGMIDL